jgi:serine/threonine protein kinase
MVLPEDPVPDPRRTEQDLNALAADFEVHGQLARGGMSVVYRAFDRTRGIEVAVKVLRAKYLDDEDALARFAREARVAVGLEHPNIVRTYELRQLGGDALALVMQFVHGQTLRQAMREQGRLPIPRAERILRDILDALAYAHRRGIVHRDVKPENIFLSEAGTALLSDFGIALSLDAESQLTRTGVTLGTPNYMSPEQIDNAEVDGRGDLYSLALVGWEMLAGKRPWEGENLYGVLYNQKSEYLPLLDELREDVPPTYLIAIEGAMAKEPAERWSRAEDMSQQLAEAPLRAAVRRRRAISHGTGIYQYSKAAKDEATIRLRLPRVDAPAMPPRPSATPRTPPDTTEQPPAPSTSRRRSTMLLTVAAVTVFGAAVTMAALKRTNATPLASPAAAPVADAAAAAAPIPEAVQLVRDADSAAGAGGLSELSEAVNRYERALGLGIPRDPVVGRLALSYALLAEQGGRHRALRDDGLFARAAALTDSSLRSRTPVAEAWLARATLRSLEEGSTAEINAAIRRAREENPTHPELMRLEGIAPAFGGELREASERLRATAGPQASPRTHRDLVEVLLALHSFDSARAAADSAILLHPRMGALYILRARAEMQIGELRAAWADAEIGARLGERAAGEALYALLDVREGDMASARTRADALVPRGARRRSAAMHHTQAVPFAGAFAAVGNHEAAVQVLQRIRPRGARFCLALQAPELDPLRKDSGFGQLANGCAPMKPGRDTPASR